MSLSSEQNEDLRHAVFETLVVRYPAALPLGGIRRRVEREVDFSFDDFSLLAALEFLREKNRVKFTEDELGSSKWWSATADGVQQQERGH